MHAGRKFIETIKLIDRGCDCYDELVSSIIIGRYAWARGDGDIKSLLRNSIGLPEPDEIISKLTIREKEIVCKIKEGKSNKKIADELFISVKTVESIKFRMIKKASS